MSNSVQDKVLFKKKYLNFYVSNILRLTLKKKKSIPDNCNMSLVRIGFFSVSLMKHSSFAWNCCI